MWFSGVPEPHKWLGNPFQSDGFQPLCFSFVLKCLVCNMINCFSRSFSLFYGMYGLRNDQPHLSPKTVETVIRVHAVEQKPGFYYKVSLCVLFSHSLSLWKLHDHFLDLVWTHEVDLFVPLRQRQLLFIHSRYLMGLRLLADGLVIVLNVLCMHNKRINLTKMNWE